MRILRTYFPTDHTRRAHASHRQVVCYGICFQVDQELHIRLDCHIRRHFIHAILTPSVLSLSLALLLRLELVTLLPVKVVVVIEPAARAPARTETAAPLRPRSVHA
eukprot:448237_1